MNDRQIVMMEQLQYTDKLNAISQLAASVAHEIRNPMTTIKGVLQLFKEEKNLTSGQQSFVNISLNELGRTQTIIDDFLTLAKPASAEYETIDVSRQLPETIEFMRPFSIYSDVTISFEIEPGLNINGNVNEFKQLIINVVKNGIEAMPTGGHLQITAIKYRGTIQISIRDKGVGLSQKQIKQLGQPYYSTKTKGTGLGLMISFDILKKMNGKYKITSKVNEGTNILLQFPEK
jgi:two-component system, sporulation sensor kinase B